MQTDKEFYFSVGLEDLPWNRLVHWYGRSTDFPDYFYELLADSHVRQKIAIREIGSNIVHETDGIIMATPFTLLFLLRFLSFDKTNKTDVLYQILDVAKAAKFQFDFFLGEPADIKIECVQELLTEKHLWPKFESEELDKINWEKYSYNDVHYYWLKYTFEIIKTFSFILKEFKNEPEMEVATKILATLEAD
ncbi:MAG: hypothetical protein IAF38_07225 [Bacteroidia bacterium]|nr:hypothetical protein [Bacteroidia bacterium]